MTRRKNIKKRPGEFEIIARVFAPLAKGYDGALGLRDDCAVITPRKDHDLILTKDALVAGVHFFADDKPADIAHKALAVNLSDLAAKGAKPLGYLLALSLPETIETLWLRKFAQGLSRLQKKYECHLIGGDTTATPGPLTISITAFGEEPKDKMVQRKGAVPGDLVYVTGTIGDSALGLHVGLHLRKGQSINFELSRLDQNFLIKRYLRPEPRLAIAPILLRYARAAMDISDGLVADLTKLCTVSGVGAAVELPQIPLSKPVQKILNKTPSTLDTLVTGGDDYELLIAVSPQNKQRFEKAAEASGVSVTKIGEFMPFDFGVKFLNASGEATPFPRAGYDHFA